MFIVNVSKYLTVAAVVLSSVAQVVRSFSRPTEADALEAAAKAVPALGPALDQLTSAIVTVGAPLMLLFQSPIRK